MNNFFTPVEKEDLQIYLEQVANIQKSNFFKFVSENDIRARWRLSRTEGFSMIYVFPDDEAIKSFVVDFSQIFLSDKQPANFQHVCNIIQKGIPDERLKQEVRVYREQYNTALNKGVIEVVLNGKKFTAKEAITDWLMGYYRHNSKEKRIKISQWKNAGGDFYKFHFINSLVELTNPILKLSLVVKKVLNTNE